MKLSQQQKELFEDAEKESQAKAKKRIANKLAADTFNFIAAIVGIIGMIYAASLFI